VEYDCRRAPATPDHVIAAIVAGVGAVMFGCFAAFVFFVCLLEDLVKAACRILIDDGRRRE
jgi:hypothetical protein